MKLNLSLVKGNDLVILISCRKMKFQQLSSIPSKILLKCVLSTKVANLYMESEANFVRLRRQRRNYKTTLLHPT